MAPSAEENAIRATVLDYIEGWFEGDAGRMERALHPELMKRCRGIEGNDPDALLSLIGADQSYWDRFLTVFHSEGRSAALLTLGLG